MALDINGIINAVTSHAMATGYFASVEEHEPKNAPTAGLTVASWFDRIELVPSSGLNASSVRLVLNVRLYARADQQPTDDIDAAMIEAMSALFLAYASDFTLDGLVRQVDLHGAAGEPLQAQGGYIEQDATMQRVITITLPLIINDVYGQMA
jgi:hypothetical protein